MSCDTSILTVKTATAKSLRLPIGAALDLSLPVTGLSLTGKVIRLRVKSGKVTYSADSNTSGSGVTISGSTIAVAILPSADFLKVQVGTGEWTLEIAESLAGPTLIQVTGKIYWV
jgi:Ethanolamine utilization protein EutJ (predicted chaperonin)